MTTADVLDWLRPLGAAMSARQLYGSDHPRVVEAVAALEAASNQLLGDREDVSLFMTEGRLTCGGKLITGAGPMAVKVFALLAARGYDRLTIARGVTPDELQLLVSGLAGASRDSGRDDAALQSSAHLRFSILDVEGETTPRREAKPAVAFDLRHLPELWRGIEAGQAMDGDLLDSVLAPLVQVVAGGDDEMLPLATLQTHDEYTATHITNVAVLTMALAEAMGMPSAAVRQVGVAALLHDIGKMKVPASILNSTGRLNAAELALMQQHPEIGARMLMGTSGIPPLAAIVAFEHHLQADGGGYPDVPRGWRINPASAMTHVSDVYDALRTHRPYRAALDHQKIVELMMRDRGPVFPAEILDVFFEQVVPRATPRTAAV